MFISRDLEGYTKRVGGDADDDLHGHPALETGSSAGRRL